MRNPPAHEMRLFYHYLMGIHKAKCARLLGGKWSLCGRSGRKYFTRREKKRSGGSVLECNYPLRYLEIRCFRVSWTDIEKSRFTREGPEKTRSRSSAVLCSASRRNSAHSTSV